jgi:glycosyltransferase involved in cell wall biosynthesis
MVIAESLSVGTPVISTNVGDIQSVIKDGFNGFLLPVSFTYSDFYDKIISILADYEHFSTNACKSSSVFNAQEIADSLISACDKILGK